MSRTTRRHEAPAKTARRGPKNRIEDPLPPGVRKTAAQQRKAVRQSLKKEDWR